MDGCIIDHGKSMGYFSSSPREKASKSLIIKYKMGNKHSKKRKEKLDYQRNCCKTPSIECVCPLMVLLLISSDLCCHDNVSANNESHRVVCVYHHSASPMRTSMIYIYIYIQHIFTFALWHCFCQLGMLYLRNIIGCIIKPLVCVLERLLDRYNSSGPSVALRCRWTQCWFDLRSMRLWLERWCDV